MLYRFNKNNQVDLQLGKSNMIISGDVIFYSDILSVRTYTKKTEKNETLYLLLPQDNKRYYLPITNHKPQEKFWADFIVGDNSLISLGLFFFVFFPLVLCFDDKLTPQVTVPLMVSGSVLFSILGNLKFIKQHFRSKAIYKQLQEKVKDKSNVLIDETNSTKEQFISGLAIYIKRNTQNNLLEDQYLIEVVSNNEQEQKENFITIQSLQKDILKNILQLEPKASSNV